VGRGGDPSIVTETENTKHVDGVIEEAWNEGNLAVIDEAIAADYGLIDNLGMLQQLGVVEPPGE